jgi:hypothetical protein
MIYRHAEPALYDRLSPERVSWSRSFLADLSIAKRASAMCCNTWQLTRLHYPTEWGASQPGSVSYAPFALAPASAVQHAKVTSSSTYEEEALGVLAERVPPLASCNRKVRLCVTFSLDWAIKPFQDSISQRSQNTAQIALKR